MSVSTFTPVPDSAAFDNIAEIYDKTFSESLVGKAQRAAVWREIDRRFRSGERILELNCGTGVDALRLAERGVQVLACDASPGMIAKARRRLTQAGLDTHAEFRVLRTEELSELDRNLPFDGALSNFAGLNCVEDLSVVSAQLAELIRPGGYFILCVFGRYCLWEMLWYLAQGNPAKAFRRLRRNGSVANLGPSATVRLNYPSVQNLKRIFAPHFRLKNWRGVGVVVPPTYVEPVAARYRQALHTAVNLEARLNAFPILRSLADHILLTFERTRI